MSNYDEKRPLLASDGSQSGTASASYSRSGGRSTTAGSTDHISIRDGHTHSGLSGQAYRSTSIDKVHPIALSWRHINVSVKIPEKKSSCCGRGTSAPATEKSILTNVSGIVQPGSLVAIMGASGAGKSTLLNVLTHRNTKSYIFTGDIRLNGWHIGEGIKNVSAYVQQDDLFIATLTVREQLQFRALLRMDNRLGKHARLERVEEVIVEMGLTNCADSRIGNAGGGKKGISGGERKRLSFASEALTNPPIFFCDEPTSGLDTFMAQNIVHTLKNMASKGRAILCTIHQPSSELFSMFNQILLLAEGRTAFTGSPDEAMTFFERMQYPCPKNYNPADHYILTLAIIPGQEEECRKKTHAICDAFQESEMSKGIATQTNELIDQAKNTNDHLLHELLAGESRYEAGWLTQFRYLFWRSWISLFRDIILFRVRIMQTFTLAVVLGLIYLRLDIDQKSVMSINGAIFLLITNTSFSNLFAVVNSFPLELSIFLREYGTGLYRVDVYYLTKTFSEVPLFVAVVIIFTAITYWMIGLYASIDAFLIAAATLLLTANVAISLGYLVSTLCGSVTVALAVAPPLLIPFMLFGGLFVNLDTTPVYFIWLEYISWFKYANEIMMVNEWRNIDHIPCDNKTMPTNSTVPPMPASGCLYADGDAVLDYSGFNEDNIIVDVAALVALIVGFRFLSFIALLIRARLSKE